VLEEYNRQQQLRSRRDMRHGGTLMIPTSSDALIFAEKHSQKSDENMDSCSIDMEDLIQYMEDASIDDIEDSVSSEQVRRYQR